MSHIQHTECVSRWCAIRKSSADESDIDSNGALRESLIQLHRRRLGVCPCSCLTSSRMIVP